MIWTNETIRELQDLVAAGFSSQDAANRLDISKGAALRMARKLKLEWANAAYGGASRRTKVADGDAKERVILLLKRGVGIERVAKITGASIDGVMRIRDQSGIPTNPVGGSGASRQWAVAVKASTPPRQVVTPLPRSTGVRTCEYLAGERRPYVRCEVPSVPGKSWCLEHCRVVFTKIPGGGGGMTNDNASDPSIEVIVDGRSTVAASRLVDKSLADNLRHIADILDAPPLPVIPIH